MYIFGNLNARCQRKSYDLFSVGVGWGILELCLTVVLAIGYCC